MSSKTARRKSSCVFLLVFLYQFSLFGQHPNDALYAILNASEFDHFTLNKLQHPSSSIQYQFSHNEFVKQFQQSRLLAHSNGGSHQFRFNLIRPLKNLKLGFSGEFSSRELFYNNVNDDVAIKTSLEKDERITACEFALSDGRALWGGKILMVNGQVDAPLRIVEFPISENSAMNTFLLDYIEPTFGDSLSYKANLSTFHPEIYAIIPINQFYDVSFHYMVTRMTFQPIVEYENRSNISELQGDRSITFNGEMNNHNLQLTLENKPNNSSLSISAFKRTVFANIKNEIPISGTMLDIPNLGSVNGDYSGGSMEYSRQLKSMLFSIGFGFGKLNGDVDVSTPVLGREILPVAHRAKVNLGGSVSTQLVKIHRRFQFDIFYIEFSAAYHHGYYDLQLDGKAELEFGLSSVPIDSPLQYHFHLFKLHPTIIKQFESVSISYGFSQLLPFVVQTDDSPISFTPTEQKIDGKTRGGYSHQIQISYSF